MREVWRPIRGWRGFYEVSSLGRLRSCARVVTKSNGVKQPVRARILRPVTSKDGYKRCALSRAGRLTTVMVHQMVAFAFKGRRPPGKQTRHRDGIKTNCRASNLCYGTHSQNQRDRIAHGTHNRGERSGKARLTRLDVRAIRRAYGRGDTSHRVLAAEYGVSYSHIRNIVVGRVWAWL